MDTIGHIHRAIFDPSDRAFSDDCISISFSISIDAFLIISITRPSVSFISLPSLWNQ